MIDFHEPTRAWFTRTLGAPTRAQAEGWPPIARGDSTLICSPTGSGKTLAAFLFAIDRLAFAEDDGPPGVRVLYISPLRALAVDVEKNLRAPLAGVLAEAARAGVRARTPTVGLRTGDTPPRERAAMLRHPPDVLITTPESLYLMLSSRARAVLATVETVIVDEIHQLVPSKRGAHLWLSLERLERARFKDMRPLQRVGLSATQRPLEVVARVLGGVGRPVQIVDAGEKKTIRLEVDAFEFSGRADVDPEAAARAGKRSIWPDVHARLLSLVRSHRSTIVFCNSRRLAERLAGALNDLAEREVARAHHGSVAREARLQIEDALKMGLLPCIVATSSLELGIDMGAVDLVVQVEAPPQIASGLQRIGRARHQVGGVPEGVILPKHRADLLACAAAAEGMLQNDVELVRWPKNPLDVLAQQIVAITLEGPITVTDLVSLVRRTTAFEDLPDGALFGVLEMLSGRYPSHAFAGLRPRVTWDRRTGMLTTREGARSVAIANAGTIPDRGLYGVYFETGGKSVRVGELDEEMVFETKEGDVFMLGATPWRAERITHDRVVVSPAHGEPARMPFWKGDRLGRAKAFGERVGALTRAIDEDPAAATVRLRASGLTERAVSELLAHVAEQRAATDAVPSDRTIVVERFTDEVGDQRVCVLTPFGARVHTPWALVVTEKLREAGHGAPDVLTTDEGIAFRVAGADAPPPLDLFLPRPDEVGPLLSAALPGSTLFAAHFRECAGRALLLPRRQPGRRTPLWAQRKRATDLLAIASDYPDFPILLETLRECLADAFDVPGLEETLEAIASGAIRTVCKDVPRPSPFARGVLFSFVGAFLYDQDLPAPERRAQALSVDHAELAELMGETDLRSLLDPDVIATHARWLQRLEDRAHTLDGLHDRLLLLGDLSDAELASRFDGDVQPTLQILLEARRAVRVEIAGQPRVVAAEDAARVRDALGCAIDGAELSEDLLEPVREPLVDLVARWAKTHGPFVAAEVAARFGLQEDAALDALAVLASRGVVRRGAFLPTGAGIEWCAADVLSAVRGKTLDALRRATRPAPPDALSRFALAWHGINAPGDPHPDRPGQSLEDVIAKLEACPLAFSVLEREVLPARVRGFARRDLDVLAVSGVISWVALEPIGARDARVVLARAEHEAALLPAPGHAEGAIAAKVRDVLERRGASFFSEICRDVGGFVPDVHAALWDLCFAHEVSNDGLEPLRTLGVVDVRGQRPMATREGRWFLRRPRLERSPSTTERLAATARALLARHGIVARETVTAEGIDGGFARLYPVLRALEDAGRVQRGLFAEGLGLQVALPSAIGALRIARDAPADTAHVLAATDPANLWGGVLPWPEHALRPARAVGARVVLVGGALAAWVPRSDEALLSFMPDDKARCEERAHAVAAALARDVDEGSRRPLLIATIDGAPARESPLVPALRHAGFAFEGPGLVRRQGRSPS